MAVEGIPRTKADLTSGRRDSVGLSRGVRTGHTASQDCSGAFGQPLVVEGPGVSAHIVPIVIIDTEGRQRQIVRKGQALKVAGGQGVADLVGDEIPRGKWSSVVGVPITGVYLL